MDRHAAHRADWVESLENRRMFSVSPHTPVLDSPPMQVALLATPQVTTPSVVGTYTGTVNDSNERSPGIMTAVIYQPKLPRRHHGLR